MDSHTASQDLERLDDAEILTFPWGTALRLAEGLQIDDEGIEDLQDLRERLLMLKRKKKNGGHKPYPQFSRIQADAATKRRNLLEIFKKMRYAFSRIPTEPLSDVLWQEKLLTKLNLLDELDERMRSLQAKETIIIVAGETNSGKSSFLNVLLGQHILKSDIVHCTYVVCKIVYSHTYSIETLDYSGHIEEHHCHNCEETRDKLKEVATCDNSEMREKSSYYKEITVKMPAEILKSGITLVDTPGIGENDAMDEVTISFVRQTQASAFIYIIKSDGAGGVQEDRLLAFLRAVKDHYKQDRLEGTFDPQAAMFVCHRWDCINPSETEKVKRNALIQLETVWPGFQPSQTFLFSSKKTEMHLKADPEFITDSLNDLLKGLKDLVDRATHGAIKYHYCWAKYFLQPACRHLRSMITHCITSNEVLENHFRSVAQKQELLMAESNEKIPTLNRKLDDQKRTLRLKIGLLLDLSDVSVSAVLDDYNMLLSHCSEDKFLQSRDNRKILDQQIIASLIRYCDHSLMKEGILENIEECILQEIKYHLGLFENQMSQIRKDMLGASLMKETELKKSRNVSFTDDLGKSVIPDPIVLNQKLDTFLQKRKSSGSAIRIIETGRKVCRQILEKLVDAGRASNNPKQYLDAQIRKVATDIYADHSCIEGFVDRYLSFSKRCIDHAINCIPQFVAVNTNLMNKIREHREAFQKDKQRIKNVMETLEPYRSHLQGYGSLHMEDVNAIQINFNVTEKTCHLQLEPGLTMSVRSNDDSGFRSGTCTKLKVRSFWAYVRNAKMDIDGISEDVTIKTYSITLNDADQYSEIASLRCLEHENIASFFGMTQIEDAYEPVTRIPSFIFKGKLCAARVYKESKFTDVKTFVPTFLNELWHGLNFIHREHLVHLELNLNTVMVELETGTVKLCYHCNPRKALLPSDLSVKTMSAICLSPAVLNGNVYEISDDVYAFGLLLWELLFPDQPPYKEEKTWPLQRFIKEIDPPNMLKSDLENLNASLVLKTVLDGCLMCSRGTVTTMKDIYSFIETIDQAPSVTSLRNRRSVPLFKTKDGRSKSVDYGKPRSQSFDECHGLSVYGTDLTSNFQSADSAITHHTSSISSFDEPTMEITTPTRPFCHRQSLPSLHLGASFGATQTASKDVKDSVESKYKQSNKARQSAKISELITVYEENKAAGCFHDLVIDQPAGEEPEFHQNGSDRNRGSIISLDNIVHTLSPRGPDDLAELLTHKYKSPFQGQKKTAQERYPGESRYMNKSHTLMSPLELEKFQRHHFGKHDRINSQNNTSDEELSLAPGSPCSYVSNRIQFYEQISLSHKKPIAQFTAEHKSDSSDEVSSILPNNSKLNVRSISMGGNDYNLETGSPVMDAIDNDSNTSPLKTNFEVQDVVPSLTPPEGNNEPSLILPTLNGKAFPTLPDIDMVEAYLPTLPHNKPDEDICDIKIDELPFDFEIENLSFLNDDYSQEINNVAYGEKASTYV